MCVYMKCNYRDIPRDFLCNGSGDNHLSRSLLRSHGSTNEVHVYALQYYNRVVLCAAVNPRMNLKLLVMVGQ